MTKTLEQYEDARLRRNYKDRMRYRINILRELNTRMSVIVSRLNVLIRRIENDTFGVCDDTIVSVEYSCMNLRKELKHLWSILNESCVRRTIGYTMDDILVDYNEEKPCTYDHFKSTMNHIEGESEWQRLTRAKKCYLWFLRSYVDNCNCMQDSCTFEDVDDLYEDKMNHRCAY